MEHFQSAAYFMGTWVIFFVGVLMLIFLGEFFVRGLSFEETKTAFSGKYDDQTNMIATVFFVTLIVTIFMFAI